MSVRDTRSPNSTCRFVTPDPLILILLIHQAFFYTKASSSHYFSSSSLLLYQGIINNKRFFKIWDSIASSCLFYHNYIDTSHKHTIKHIEDLQNNPTHIIRYQEFTTNSIKTITYLHRRLVIKQAISPSFVLRFLSSSFDPLSLFVLSTFLIQTLFLLP